MTAKKTKATTTKQKSSLKHCHPPIPADINQWLDELHGEGAHDAFIVNEPTAVTFPAVVQSPPVYPKTVNDQPSMASQEFKDQCDINMIVARWRKSGTIDHISRAKLQYGDFASATDYAAALELVESAKEAFDDMPASMRMACENNPEAFLEYCSTEEGLKTLEDTLSVPKTPAPVKQGDPANLEAEKAPSDASGTTGSETAS